MKPFSAACEQNQAPILAVLKDALADAARVLEIGSGTGQHACYFPARLTHLHWQPSDVADNLPGIRAWLSQARLANVAAPLALDVNDAWPSLTVDAVFTANTTHIMSSRTNLAMLRGVARRRQVCHLRPIQLQRRLHRRQQPPFRRLAETARPEQRHPRC